MRVEGVNLAGDDQADRRVHGGPDKAVYAYAREDAAWWADELGREIPPGMFGENLTLEGIDVSGAVIGERWRAGSVEFEVCQPRLPCSKLGLRFGDLHGRRFGEASRPGAYLRIVARASWPRATRSSVLSRPTHGITVALVPTRSCSTSRCGRGRARRRSWPRASRSTCVRPPDGRPRRRAGPRGR